MRVGFSGGRGIHDESIVAEAVEILEDVTGATVTQVAVGDCKTGVDRSVRLWCVENRIPLTVHRADWDQFYLAAGPKRNAEIVADCEVLVAIPSAKSRGTWDAYRKARGARVATLLYHAHGKKWVFSVGSYVYASSDTYIRIPVAKLRNSG